MSQVQKWTAVQWAVTVLANVIKLIQPIGDTRLDRSPFRRSGFCLSFSDACLCIRRVAHVMDVSAGLLSAIYIPSRCLNFGDFCQRTAFPIHILNATDGLLL